MSALSVGKLDNGLVLDHIKAGEGMRLYHDLHLDQMDCTVAIIKNARSNVMGRKDIIKIECSPEEINFDVVGFVDASITVNIIENGEIVGKKKLSAPKKLVNVIKCRNPRCITSLEQELEQVFILTDAENKVYRCMYCEEKFSGRRRRFRG